MAADLTEESKELEATLTGIEHVLDIDGMRREVVGLESRPPTRTCGPIKARAQALTSRLSYRRADVARVEGLRTRLDDARTALELADPDLTAEEPLISPCCARRSTHWRYGRCFPVSTTSGKPSSSCRRGPVGRHAGPGRRRRLRMYLRWRSGAAGRSRCSTPATPRRRGSERGRFGEGPPTPTAPCAANTACIGSARISPFDNQARRQMSFAGVEVTPVAQFE